jgi:hypothetical protein
VSVLFIQLFGQFKKWSFLIVQFSPSLQLLSTSSAKEMLNNPVQHQVWASQVVNCKQMELTRVLGINITQCARWVFEYLGRGLWFSCHSLLGCLPLGLVVGRGGGGRIHAVAPDEMKVRPALLLLSSLPVSSFLCPGIADPTQSLILNQPRVVKLACVPV